MATEADNVNSGALGTLVAVGTIAFAGIALVVTALVRAEMAEELEKKEVSADRPFRDLVAEQTAKLNAPASYVDRGRGLVSLPIDRAMELTVAGLAKDPNSATPPPPVGGAGGVGGGATEAGGSGGMGGVGGSGGTAGEAAATEGEKKEGEEPKPAEEPKKEDEKKDEKKGAEKKEAPKPKAPAAPGAPGSPAAPAPVAPTPPPAAPSPAPNGQ